MGSFILSIIQNTCVSIIVFGILFFREVTFNDNYYFNAWCLISLLKAILMLYSVTMLDVKSVEKIKLITNSESNVLQTKEKNNYLFDNDQMLDVRSILSEFIFWLGMIIWGWSIYQNCYSLYGTLHIWRWFSAFLILKTTMVCVLGFKIIF